MRETNKKPYTSIKRRQNLVVGEREWIYTLILVLVCYFCINSSLLIIGLGSTLKIDWADFKNNKIYFPTTTKNICNTSLMHFPIKKLKGAQSKLRHQSKNFQF